MGKSVDDAPAREGNSLKTDRWCWAPYKPLFEGRLVTESESYPRCCSQGLFRNVRGLSGLLFQIGLP